ncbi:hypothetical protein L596_024484 [Steinernema carpocapsae]|uniref:Uncharacterized protein n=1 Tax=Steinernema carpocapsae TaxID=34508 RepID=A0A4U5MGX2_STECR|nr:hypothetical protein L596_024484 [Steinernema carpocapsae]
MTFEPPRKRAYLSVIGDQLNSISWGTFEDVRTRPICAEETLNTTDVAGLEVAMWLKWPACHLGGKCLTRG